MKYICEHCKTIFDDENTCKKHCDICEKESKFKIKKISFDG